MVVLIVRKRCQDPFPLTVFRKEADYAAFERILGEALEQVAGMRLLAYSLMPIHWHLVVWPRRDGELSISATGRH